MNDYLDIVKTLNDGCKILFAEPFKLVSIPGHHNIYVFQIQGTSFARNRQDFEPVKVLRWFSNYWVYLELKFVKETIRNGKKNTNVIHTYISLSIYQGEDDDDRKFQLFRAEWDDLNNPNERHSQPHWHITSSQSIEKAVEEYSNDLDDGEFIDLVLEISNSVFDVKKIHFAMNGNWYNNQTHVHKIIDAKQVSKWLMGLLTHIRYELEE